MRLLYQGFFCVLVCYVVVNLIRLICWFSACRICLLHDVILGWWMSRFGISLNMLSSRFIATVSRIWTKAKICVVNGWKIMVVGSTFFCWFALTRTKNIGVASFFTANLHTMRKKLNFASWTLCARSACTQGLQGIIVQDIQQVTRCKWLNRYLT